MQKKSWAQPEINELSVKATEYGTQNKVIPDASFSDGKHTYYSYS